LGYLLRFDAVSDSQSLAARKPSGGYRNIALSVVTELTAAMAQDKEGDPEHKLSRQEAVLVSALRQNIERYRKQLDTELGEDERRFVERCLAEEQAMLERLVGGLQS
jgi:precorrin-2 methylase